MLLIQSVPNYSSLHVHAEEEHDHEHENEEGQEEKPVVDGSQS